MVSNSVRDLVNFYLHEYNWRRRDVQEAYGGLAPLDSGQQREVPRSLRSSDGVISALSSVLIPQGNVTVHDEDWDIGGDQRELRPGLPVCTRRTADVTEGGDTVSEVKPRLVMEEVWMEVTFYVFRSYVVVHG